MNTCPVCGRKVASTTDYIEFTLCEEYFDCPCGYSYEFAYGAQREYFGWLEYVGWVHRNWRWRLYRWLWQVISFDGCIHFNKGT